MNIKPGLHLFIPYSLLITVFVACDTLENDPIAPKNLVKFSQTDYYVLSGGSLLINLNTVVKQSWTNVTMRISKRPSHGDLNFYDSLTLKYQSDKSFKEGKDVFEASALSNGKVIATRMITINIIANPADIECGDTVSVHALEDFVFTKSDSSIAIDAMTNDHFCGLHKAQATLSIYSNPKNGEAKLEGNSILYTPSPGFTGIDNMVYFISGRDPSSSGNDDLATSYAVITIQISSGLCNFIPQDYYILDLIDNIYDGVNFEGCEGAYEITNISNMIAGNCETQNALRVTLVESSQNHGWFCVDNASFSYSPDSATQPQNDTARYNICVDGQCKIVTLCVISRVPTNGVWTVLPANIGEPMEFLTMFFISEQTGFVGGSNKILKTTNGGETWKNTIPTAGLGHNTYFFDIHFLDEDNGYASFTTFDPSSTATGGGLLKTSNGGETWELKPFTEGITYIHFISPSTGFVAKRRLGPEEAGIYKTIDGGTTWELVYQGLDGEGGFHEIKDIVFLNSTNGYAMFRDNHSYVLETTNAGETWSPKSSIDYMYALSHSGQTLFCATNTEGTETDRRAALWKSPNGEEWSKVVDQAGVVVWDLSFSPRGTIGMGVGSSVESGSLAMITHDAGITWENQPPSPYAGLFNNVSIPSERMAYVLASDDILGAYLLRYEVN